MMSSTTNITDSPGLAQKRALLASRLKRAASEPRRAQLSFAQQRLWFLDQLEPNSSLYNIGAVAKVTGTMDSTSLQRALEMITDRHETLRTCFSCPDGTPVQIIDPTSAFQLGMADLSSVPEPQRESEAQRRVRAELNRPFDLSSDHPLRATLLELGPQEYRLVLILHHIIADEWSLKVLFNELVQLYSGLLQGQKPNLPELAIQYSDYGRWQRQWLQGEPLQQQLRYWTDQLTGFPPETELPTDHPRGSMPTFQGKTVSRALREGLAQELKELGARHEATLFMVLLAAFKTLVFRYTHQEDLIICSPVAGRNRVETENLIGFFVNTLALRTSLAGDPGFNEVLARVRTSTLGAMAHQDLPFERLVEELQPERSLAHLPFTRLMFSFQTGFPEKIELPGATLRFMNVEPELAKFDLTLVLKESGQGLSATIEYNSDLFQAQTVERLLGHFEVLLEGIVAQPQARLSTLPMLTGAEEHQLLVEWNRTTKAYPRDSSTHELFEAQVARTPEAIAVTWGRQRMTYSELNSRANQLARYLKQFDIKPDLPVGLCLTRSPEMLVGMLGILKAGGAYVPLDANYPGERLAFMLEDVGAPVILTQQRLLGRIPRDHGSVICLDADWELVAREHRENLTSSAGAASLAYVMYTSGSTGRPKGVSVLHRGINRLVINNDFIQLDASDRIAQVSNISFDAATFEIWGALLNGAQLVGITRDVALSPKDFATELREQGITAMFVTAALFNQLASEAPGAFETLRTVIAGGEALDPNWVRAVLSHRPPKRLVNGYGPTENTTFTCCHTISRLSQHVSNVPIGKPISNTTVYILDQHLKPVPVGVAGQLYTGGDGLARGYWNRPELTSERFIPNPFDPKKSSCLYKTGDLARFLPDGMIEFLGRIDDQVKIRGFRIELGEIEALLGTHAAVRECVVTVCGNTSAEKRLVAYVVAKAEPAPNASELRSFLVKHLPDYMIPSAFVAMDALPLTPNGKVDRKALPAPDQTRPSLDRQYIAPRDPTETQLVSIWEKVLAVHPIGIQDKFFDLGGHSMLAVLVIAEIEKAFGRKLRLATLFQAPTIERLARVLRGEVKEAAVTSGTSLVEIQSGRERPPLFLVHGAGGGMFWGYVNLARCLGNDQPVYGFKSRGLDGQEELSTIQEMAARYVADLRKLQPEGPYHLGGYCFGGNVAYEMACQLVEQGQKVGVLALLNCAPPHSSYSKIPWTPQWWLRFARNLVYWGNYFRHWSSTQRREFFKWKWNLAKKRLKTGWRLASGEASKVDPGDFVDLSSYTEDQKRTWETHIRALVNFYPRPYQGSVHLFRSPGHPLWCSYDENYGWSELARQGVQLVTVPGAHEKILEDPWVKELAQKLSTVLSRAQEMRGEKRVPDESSTAQINSRNGIPETNGQLNGGTVTPPQSHQPDQRVQALNYWKRQLQGIPDLLDLPADRPRPAQNPGATVHYNFTVSQDVAHRAQSLAETTGCQLADVSIAALAAVLKRYTGTSQVVIGTVVRSALPMELAPLRCDLSGDPSFEQLLSRVHRARVEALENSSVAFAEIVSALRPDKSSSYSPLFQVFCSTEDLVELPRFQGKKSSSQIETCDLIIRFTTGNQGLACSVQYNAALFDTARIQRLTQHFETLLRSGVSQPDRHLSSLDLLPEVETKTLLVDWNATEQAYPHDKSLPDLFREQSLRTPDAVALVVNETRLTYAELFRFAARMAERLRALGVGPESLVGICLERSAEMVVAILGTLVAGGAYVPLDPKYPKERLAFTLQDAKAKVLITQTHLRGLLPETGAHLIEMNSLDDLVSGRESDTQISARPGDLAYVIYTSGSTGRPKGVALEHRNAVEMVCWAKQTFSIEELTGVLFSTSICFDLSVFELFVPLCCGGKVILAENALALGGLGPANEVRMINTVPSAIRELLRMRAVPPTVQVINLAGEPLSSDLVDQIYSETRVAKVFDLYGPTETTTYSTGGIRRRGQRATIGRPLANEQVYLLDSALRLVPIGNPGELFIGGDGVARGYLNQPRLTEERFIAHPFKPGARLYRTGDLARWRADGMLEYLGRSDHQVKIRGFRIELGEIEAALKAYPGVSSTVVVAREDIPGEKTLVAYVVPHKGVVISTEDLKAALRAQMPEFMTPSGFVFLEQMPLTPNGKVDRKALPTAPPRSETSRPNLLPPRNAIEEQLIDIWSEVLRTQQIGVEDNFFELGGHSLSAVRVIAAIRDGLGIELPVSAMFSTPTVASLAEIVSEKLSHNGHASSASIRPVSRTGDLPVSHVQERLWFLDQLEPGSAAYNVSTALRLEGKLDHLALVKALNRVVARHESLRSTYQYKDGKLVQIIAESLVLEIPCISLEAQPGKTIEDTMLAVLAEHARLSFKLATGPLIRLTLFQLTPADHCLLVVMHHSVSDGWSLAVFFEELAGFYDAAVSGNESGAPSSLPIQYADFASWQRNRMSGSLLESELAYWKNTLAGAPTEIALPVDHARLPQSSGRARTESALIDATSVERLSAFGRQRSCTPFMLFLTSLLITLRKWTGQKDLVVGTVVAGRTRRELEGLIGCFMNFLPLRAQVEDDRPACDILSAVRSAVLGAQAHQECPFEKIVEAINPRRRQDQNPLYNVALLLQNFPENLFGSTHLRAHTIPVSSGAALLDLRFEIETAATGLSLTCEYKPDLFEQSTIREVLTSWQQTLEMLAASPDTLVGEFKFSQGSLQLAQGESKAKGQEEHIVVSGTFTTEPVSEALKYWFARLNLPVKVEFAPYNQVFQQLLDPASALRRNIRGLNVLFIRPEDWRETTTGFTSKLASQSILRNAGEFIAALKSAAASCPVPFLICICPASSRALADQEFAKAVREAQQLVEKEVAGSSGIYLLSPEELQRWYPVADVADAAAEELGHVPYTQRFFTALASGVVRKYNALKRPPFKVIALDCDNTLWSGVCGEDGPEGVALDAARRGLQEFMRQQRDAGMLLCLCSKNNEEDVQSVFARRSEFPLKMAHFAGLRLNWSSKSANLKSLAAELNLGLDTFIFLDDNPVECAEVQANCPEVLTIQLPDDPRQIPNFLSHCWAFDHLSITAEDRNRAELYRQNRLREELREQTPTLEDFLAGLVLKISIEPITPEDFTRVAQLTQRTNQFNFTTRRITEQELAAYLASNAGCTVRVSDRFGDYGLVGVVLYQVCGDRLSVDNALLSCRVLGRGIEHRLLAQLGEIARQKKLNWVDINFVPSTKNKPALNFLEECCGAFKQPLNGGFMFRMPAQFAGQIAFEPKKAGQSRGPQFSASPNSPSGQAPSLRSDLCCAIALEGGDLEKIEDRIRTSVSGQPEARTEYAPPTDDLQRQLCKLWQDLLRTELVGVNDDFFELGGHSLLAVRLFAEIEKLLGRKFPLVTLFQAPTIAQLSRVLSEDQGAGSLLVPIQPNGDKPPLFLIHGAGGDVLWGYANVATHLPADQPVYGIRSQDGHGEQKEVHLEEMARAYVDVVRGRQPRGPYYLGGYCFGGNVAYEMARQLRMQGEEVDLVVLLDTAPANAGYEAVPWWRPTFVWRFGRNARFWLSDFVALDSVDRRRLVGRKIRAAARRLRKYLGSRQGSPERFNVEEVIDPRHFPEHELKLWQIHLEALIAHVERPYSGRVALLRTRGQPLFCSLQEDFCWRKLVRGPFTLRCIPGSHESIFMEPNVRVLAVEIVKLLKETRSARLNPAPSLASNNSL